MATRLHVNRSNLAQTELVQEELAPGDGQVLVEVERFALTTNNITYAVFGDLMGYWAYFSTSQDWGCVPVWGLGRVSASRCAEVEVGERLFGYFPMASEVVLTPSAASTLCFSDASEQRSALHPWYNRYYRSAADPVFSAGVSDLQPALWALFMTGWMLAEELAAATDTVLISSASSKTALATAWSLRAHADAPQVVGVTSEGNRSFVEGLGAYDAVLTYADDPGVTAGERVAYVDVAGNPTQTSRVHVALADRLVRSVTLGATHRAMSTEALPMPGPTPALFFIPDAAEAEAARVGLDVYHGRFAEAFGRFNSWASGWMEVQTASGDAAVEAAYHAALAGGLPANQATVLTWRA